jgi:transposase
MGSDSPFSRPNPSKAARIAEASAEGAPRVLCADRRQLEWRAYDLEALLPEDHRARTIWMMVERLDLGAFYAPLRARGSTAGRPAIDPKILVALWLYATSDNVGSARRLAQLCESHDAYRWICGGVAVNHHTLSDFRVGHEKALDELMTQVLGVAAHRGLLDLRRTSQDGMRVRASAGAASFRREKSLEACLEEARAAVVETKRQADEPDTQRSSREKAARERAARERLARVERALAELPKARAAKEKKDRENARVSTTDAEARVMKMGDGGFRPAYNVQLATDNESRMIVGVDLTNSGSDMGLTEPMLDDIERRTGRRPVEHLVDGGFTKLDSIDKAAEEGTTVYAPVPTPRRKDIDPHAPKEGDSPSVAEWRARMGTPTAKEIYKERAATAETTNADLRVHRALDRFIVRGKTKVLSVVLWSALAYNVLRLLSVSSVA